MSSRQEFFYQVSIDYLSVHIDVNEMILTKDQQSALKELKDVVLTFLIIICLVLYWMINKKEKSHS